ncbi:MAG TPA: hypothetical protein VEI06_08175 [Gemmatimonadaceae bacterium]|nr:hypothetical protein [Gemmatimonadaceae bacterium]
MRALSMVVIAGLLVTARTAAAQQATDVAKTLGLSVYPSSNQTPAQMQKDEGECSTWATGQASGFDPAGKPPNKDSAMAAGKAKADSSYQGGGLREKKTREEAEKKYGEAYSKAADSVYAQKKTAFKNGFQACMKGRGYTLQ